MGACGRGAGLCDLCTWSGDHHDANVSEIYYKVPQNGELFCSCGVTVCILRRSNTIYIGHVHDQEQRSNSNRGRKSYLDIGEEHFEHVGGRVAGVKEHQLGLLQVVGRQTLLNLKISALRKQI